MEIVWGYLVKRIMLKVESKKRSLFLHQEQDIVERWYIIYFNDKNYIFEGKNIIFELIAIKNIGW